MDRLSARRRERARGRRRRETFRGPFLPVLLACLGLHLAWAFAMPITSAPDEPAHVYRALSLWNGDPSRRTRGRRAVARPGPPVGEHLRGVDRLHPVAPGDPRQLRGAHGGVVRAATPRWGPAPAGTSRSTTTRWVAGHLDSGVPGFYAMRVMSLLVASVLLALAITTFLRTVGVRWACLVLPIAHHTAGAVARIGREPQRLGAGRRAPHLGRGLALVSRFSSESIRALWAEVRRSARPCSC